LLTESGVALLRQLVARSDALVTNVRPASATKLQIDYRSLQEVNQQIVYCSITGFGTTGPYHQEPGFDPLIQARCGISSAQGGTGQEPVLLSVGLIDMGTALTATCGIAAALYHRERTGEGQFLETSLINAGLTMQADAFVLPGTAPQHLDGGRDLVGPTALRRLYSASDAWFIVCADQADAWASLTSICGREDLRNRYPGAIALAAPAAGELGAELAAMFATDTVEHWCDKLWKADIRCAPVQSYAELFHNEHARANDLFVSEWHPEWGLHWSAGDLITFFDCDPPALRRAPLLGENTEQVLQELGYDLKAIAEFRDHKIVV
jgi:crotonobetainyl-CoA:carnitine CoA-transferase CaiB-like acyl-CoA transferase